MLRPQVRHRVVLEDDGCLASKENTGRAPGMRARNHWNERLTLGATLLISCLSLLVCNTSVFCTEWSSEGTRNRAATTLASSAPDQTKRPFTVKDLIEISYFIDPTRRIDSGPLHGQQLLSHSPDGKYLLVATQRGVLSDNTLEGTIWLIDARAVNDYAWGKSETKPKPRKLVTLSATSNTPVISDLRWIDGSKRISFLGKNNSPYQQLFVVDVETGSMKPLTKENSYVTAYDMQGNTVAYTSLSQELLPADFDSDLIDVGERSLWTLYGLSNGNPSAAKDVEVFALSRLPHSLRVQKAGRELPVEFMMGKRPLRLFSPALFLSPDAKTLITSAPVRVVPTG